MIIIQLSWLSLCNDPLPKKLLSGTSEGCSLIGFRSIWVNADQCDFINKLPLSPAHLSACVRYLVEVSHCYPNLIKSYRDLSGVKTHCI